MKKYRYIDIQNCIYKKLQLVQNVANLFIILSRKHDDVIRIPFNFHLLPIKNRIICSIRTNSTGINRVFIN